MLLRTGCRGRALLRKNGTIMIVVGVGDTRRGAKSVLKLTAQLFDLLGQNSLVLFIAWSLQHEYLSLTKIAAPLVSIITGKSAGEAGET